MESWLGSFQTSQLDYHSSSQSTQDTYKIVGSTVGTLYSLYLPSEEDNEFLTHKLSACLSVLAPAVCVTVLSPRNWTLDLLHMYVSAIYHHTLKPNPSYIQMVIMLHRNHTVYSGLGGITLSSKCMRAWSLVGVHEVSLQVANAVGFFCSKVSTHLLSS